MLSAAVLAFSEASFADSPSPTAIEEARGHFQRGVAFYKEVDYRSALVEFQAAYQLAPNPRVLFNIGQTNEELQDFAGALLAFKQYLDESGPTLAKARRAEVELALKRLQTHVSSLAIDVDQPGAAVVIEGERRVDVGKPTFPAEVVLNAGRWTVVARKAGFEAAEESIIVAGGDRKRVTLHLAPVAAAAPIAVVPPPVVDAPAVDRASPPPPRPSRVPVFVVGSITAAAAIAGGVTGLLTLGAKSDYEDALGAFPGNRRTIDDERSRTKTLSLTTDILFGVAIVGAVVTVALYLTTSPKRAPITPASR